MISIAIRKLSSSRTVDCASIPGTPGGARRSGNLNVYTLLQYTPVYLIIYYTEVRLKRITSMYQMLIKSAGNFRLTCNSI